MSDKDQGFVSGRMAGIQTPAPSRSARIEYQPRREVSRAVEGRTSTPDWIRQPANPNSIIIARDSFERPIELQDEEWMKANGLLPREFEIGDVQKLQRPFSLYPFTINWNNGNPQDGDLRKDLIASAIVGNRYEAKYNDESFIQKVCHDLVQDAEDPTQGGKYFSRSKFPRIPAGTAVTIVPHEQGNETFHFITCGRFNVYVVEVAEGAAKGLRFIAYSSDLKS